MKKYVYRAPTPTISDEKIIELYWARDEAAITETDAKYKRYLFSVAYNIVRDDSDCEECLNDTYLGAWNAIPPSRPSLLKAFLGTIMRRTAINRYHRNIKKGNVPSEMTVALSELGDIISGNAMPEEEFDAMSLGGIISEFICSLTERRKFIFIGRYYMAETIDAIAKELAVSKSTVNKELAAIRARLKEKLESEGYSV